MYQQLEGSVSLYREANSVLKMLNYHSLHYGDLIHPSKITKICTKM